MIWVMMHISLLMQFINWHLSTSNSCHPGWGLWYPEQQAEITDLSPAQMLQHLWKWGRKEMP